MKSEPVSNYSLDEAAESRFRAALFLLKTRFYTEKFKETNKLVKISFSQSAASRQKLK